MALCVRVSLLQAQLGAQNLHTFEYHLPCPSCDAGHLCGTL